MFWGKIPLLRLVIPFGLGISIYAFLGFRSPCLLLISIVFFCLAILIHLSNLLPYKLRWINGFLYFFIFFTAGNELAYLNDINHYHSYYKQYVSKDSFQKDTFLIRVDNEITPTKKAWKAETEVKAIKKDGKWISCKGKLLCYFENSSDIKNILYGDEILVTGNIQETKPPKNPNEFNYKRYLYYHQINFTAFIPNNSWKRTKINTAYLIYEKAYELRNNLIDAMKTQGLDKNELAVASALMLGYKDLIEDDLQRAYSSAGAMHVLAVSGLHVGIVYGIFSFLLSFLSKIKFGNFFKVLFLLLLIWCYALITGLSPSVLRATTMFTFVIIGKSVERHTNFFNTLAASALVLLLINPYLLMEVGFQLSYLAVAGIVLMYSWFYNWFSFESWALDKIWQLTSVSLAAQIATFPLGLYYFHQFPLLFPVSNLVVIPAAGAILIIGILFSAFLWVPIVNEFISFLLKWTVKITNEVVFFINNIEWSLIENIRVEMLDTWILYLSISSFLIFLSTLKKNFIYTSLLGVVLVISIQVFRYNQYNKQKLIVFYNAGNNTLLQLVDGRESLMIGDSDIIQDTSSLLFFTQNNRIKLGLKQPLSVSYNKSTNKINNIFYQHPFMGIYDKKILLLRNKEDLLYNFNTNFDYVILSNNLRVSIERLSKNISFNELVLDSSNSFKQINYWRKGCKKNNIKFIDVKNDGGNNIAL